jgi:hypothetical protein
VTTARKRSRTRLWSVAGTGDDTERGPVGIAQSTRAARAICDEVNAVATEARAQLGLGEVDQLDLLFRRLDALLARESDILSVPIDAHADCYPTYVEQRLLP